VPDKHKLPFVQPIPDMPATEFDRVQYSRKHVGLDPLPNDHELNDTLKRAGFDECLGIKYEWAR